MNRRESYRSERGGPNDDCPIEATLDIVGGKWKVLILFYLMKGTVRFGEFQRLIPKITQRMLTLQLLTARRKSRVLSKRERVSFKRPVTSQLFLAQLTEAGHRPL